MADNECGDANIIDEQENNGMVLVIIIGLNPRNAWLMLN